VDGKVILWLERGSEKDETDTVLALVLAVSLGYGRIDILGALGGRVDHALANIEALLWCMRAGVEAYIVDPRNRVRAVGAQSHGACVEFTAADSYGRYISFIPMSDAVTGVTLEGFRYPLHDKTLVPGAEPGLCVSNELAGEAGRLRFSSGTLLCIESRD
jgi:thiamine pyrophosphokinase